MRIAVLSPIAWRTPPRHYGPWENVASLIAEGLVSRGHDVTLFATADSQTRGLHPIQFDEPFGLSVIESMACGTPVIAFNRGSMPELIEERKNGFLVNNEDEAVESLAHIKEIDRAYCRSHVEQHFTVERMVDEYIKVYEIILKDRQQ